MTLTEIFTTDCRSSLTAQRMTPVHPKSLTILPKNLIILPKSSKQILPKSTIPRPLNCSSRPPPRPSTATPWWQRCLTGGPTGPPRKLRRASGPPPSGGPWARCSSSTRGSKCSTWRGCSTPLRPVALSWCPQMWVLLASLSIIYY